MTMEERIAKFIKKYPTPKQYQIRLGWSRKDGKHEQICGCGTPLEPYGNYVLLRSCGPDFLMVQFRYDKIFKMLEVAVAKFDCHVPKEGNEKRFEYLYRYFIPKEEKRVYNSEGGDLYEYDLYIPRGDGKGLLQSLTALTSDPKNFSSAFMALTDGAPDVPPRYEMNISCVWILPIWFVHTPKIKTKNYNPTPLQKKIDKLIASDSGEDGEKAIKEFLRSLKKEEPGYHNSYYQTHISYYDEKLDVIKIYRNPYDTNTFIEDYRFYLKEAILTKKAYGGWIPAGNVSRYSLGGKIVNIEALFKTPYRGYIEKIYSVSNEEFFHNYNASSPEEIIKLVKNPIFEQLTNMGCPLIASMLFNCYGNNVKTNAINFFGEKINKKGGVCKEYGLTKNQINIMNDIIKEEGINSYAIDGIITNMEYIFKPLISLDDNTFKDVFKLYTRMYEHRMLKGQIKGLNNNEARKVIMRLIRLDKTHRDVMHVLNDLLVTVVYDAPISFNINIWDLSSYEQICRNHDTAVELRNIEMAERRRLYQMGEEERNKELEKKREKIDKARENLNYEDENYIIRIPKNLSEIVEEGSILSHCVGGYKDSHAEGLTTILFLRKKSDPDRPFYTIQLTNENRIQQIHGRFNRWLGNDIDAIPSVRKWIAKNNIFCEERIIRSNACGYRDTGTLVNA